MSEQTAITTPNYGDCALNLPADWSRSRLSSGFEFHLKTVGHDNGLSDLRLTAKPGERHQFQWCAKKDESRLNALRTKRYVIVKSSEWTKNPNLWEWDGEGLCIHDGEFALAREESYYLAEREAEERSQNHRRGASFDSPEEERAARAIESRGGVITDDRGRELKPLRQQRR